MISRVCLMMARLKLAGCFNCYLLVYGCVLLFLLLRLVEATNIGAGVLAGEQQRFAMQPQDQTAVVGSRVTLPCRVIDKKGMLQWTKDDFGLGTHRNLSGFDRYSMVGSDEEGDFSLDIFPVMLEDDARYQCQVSPGSKGDPGIRSEYAKLTVLVPPEAPKISQGAVLTTTEDREIELECVSAAGKPAAEITWIDGHGNVMTQGVENINTKLADGRRFTVKSILKWTPRREHHNTTFRCQAQNTAERSHRTAHIQLEVKYAPKVRVSIISGTTANGRIPEGAEVRFGCSADSNPPDVTYRWYLNDRLIAGDFTTEMILHNVTREYHDQIVKCEVHNPVGKSEESEALDVAYAPVFRTKPQSVQAEYGTVVTLTCDVDSNPPADIAWSHDTTPDSATTYLWNKEIHKFKDTSWGDDDRLKVSSSVGRNVISTKRRHEEIRIESSNPNLTLTVTHRTSGRYFCRASVPGFPEIGAEAYVYLKGPPTIISHKTQFGIEGDNVRVECVAFSIPKPEHVVWSFNGHDVDHNDQDYSILEDPLPEGVKSTLIIRESQHKHFGMYNCSVRNPYGSDVVAINLMPQKSFPLLLTITAILLGIIFIIIIIMVFFLCQRQNKKPPKVDTNTLGRDTRQSDRSSSISDLKLDLRADSSVSNMDYTTGATHIGQCGSDAGSESRDPGGGVPIANPGPHSLDMEYRYSAEYIESKFTSSKNGGQNNNGYVPYAAEYSRDFSPSTLLHHSQDTLKRNRVQHLQSNNNFNSLISSLGSLSGTSGYITNTLPLTELNPSYPVTNGGGSNSSALDLRYSGATFTNNPYLKNTASVGLPPPNTAILAATPAPPPYTRNATSNGVLPQVVRLPNSPNSTHITVPTNNLTSTKLGTLATHV